MDQTAVLSLAGCIEDACPRTALGIIRLCIDRDRGHIPPERIEELLKFIHPLYTYTPSIGIEEGSNLLTTPNSGIESFEQEWEVDSKPEPICSQDPSPEILDKLNKLMKSTLEKFIRLMWFQHGVLTLDNEAIDDGEFNLPEKDILLTCYQNVLDAEKSK